ncbi:MAG TPA: histidine phosphatase family protein [Kouleothrix sp.]|uniref:histidine phosphatase family protein n=1 Tax=Kouleothrix sp. TaxID=2779161 RepID=UPI002C42B1F5|nr:histidine phosphatase family protein [Kouleothrix sp.]HRC74559.1 histidine phosphatase family protein [Kouleothrix sp.]
MIDRLILIRHSQSQPTPGEPPSLWPLTAAGRARCELLAERLRAYDLDLIVGSDERKTRETAALAAARLGLPCSSAPDLHEHRREHTSWMQQHAFDAAVAGGFARPGELVFGEETFAQARERFGRAVRAVLAANPDRRLAIVAHGTVLALFVAQHAGIAPLPFWRSLGMPAIVALSLPDFSLLDVAARVE